MNNFYSQVANEFPDIFVKRASQDNENADEDFAKKMQIIDRRILGKLPDLDLVQVPRVSLDTNPESNSRISFEAISSVLIVSLQLIVNE